MADRPPRGRVGPSRHGLAKGYRSAALGRTTSQPVAFSWPSSERWNKPSGHERNTSVQRQRICFVVTELLGLERNGGIGTAISHMALVLARHGHLVDMLHCGHRHDVEEPWATRYAAAGINIRILDRSIEVRPERRSDELERLPDAQARRL